MKKNTNKIIAGVDEAGRGPLAGPVFAAAVILNSEKSIKGLTDSKLLTAKKRELLFKEIQQKSLSYAIAFADVHEIDSINILQASLLAMQRAVKMLNIDPELVLVDGNIPPKLSYETQAIIGGDKLIPAISAASILAKVARDEVMQAMDAQYPGYGFAQHKGYATAEHLLALQRLGPCAIHRKTFAPVKDLLKALDDTFV